MESSWVGSFAIWVRRQGIRICFLLMADLRIETRSLSQEGARYEPETVGDGELILYNISFIIAGVRIVPLVRWEASHDEQSETDEDVGSHDIQPNLHSQWIHKWKQPSWLTGRYLLHQPQYQSKCGGNESSSGSLLWGATYELVRLRNVN